MTIGAPKPGWQGNSAVSGAFFTKKRVLRYAVILLIFSHASYIVAMLAGEFPFDVFDRPFAVDFTAKVTGGQIALDGDYSELYLSDHQWQVQQELLNHRDAGFLNLFIAPAAVTLLYAPLAALPYFPAALIWIVASLGLFLAAFRSLWTFVPQLHSFGFWRLLVVAFSAPPVIECLQTGQDSLLSLLLMSVAIRWLMSGRDLAAGAVIGLGLYKPQLFILFPVVLLAQRRWHALAGFSATAFLIGGTSLLLTGPDGIAQQVRLLMSDEYSVGIAEAQAWHMMSLSAVVRGAVPLEMRTVVDGLVLVAGAAVAYAIARRAQGPGMPSENGTLRVLGSTVLITGLSIPHFFSYDCAVLIVPALILLNQGAWDRRVQTSVALLYIALFAALPLHVLASDAAGPIRVLDAQWAVIPMIALVWLSLRPAPVSGVAEPVPQVGDRTGNAQSAAFRGVSSSAC
jgi:hypothetical protein